MLSGLVSLSGSVDADLCAWIEDLWTEDQRPIRARAAAPDLFMLASNPDSPLWQSDEIDRGNSRGVYAARLPELDPDRLVADLCSIAGPQKTSINGAFAVAHVQGGTLLLIRDLYGQVPIYWRRIGNQILFSSVFTDFTKIPGHPHDVDERHHGLARNGVTAYMGDYSTLHGVRRAVPGSVTKIGLTSHSSRSLWAVDDVGVDSSLSFEDAVDRMDESISKAVSCCVDPSEMIGSHFSGGIDSTLVAFLAHRDLEREGACLTRLFSWSPDLDTPLPDGESHRIRHLASDLDVPLWFGPEIPNNEILSRDSALQPTNTLLTEVLCLREAQADKVGVLLSGWGGDEWASFCGRHYVENLFRRGEYRRAFRQGMAEYRVRGGPGLLKRLRAVANVAKRWWAALPHHLSRSIGSDASPESLSLEMSYQYGESSSAREIMKTVHESGGTTARIEHWWEEGRCHGVEYRYPLLDTRVVETALMVPEALWANRGVKRAIIREVTDRHIDSVWTRKLGKGEPEIAQVRRARNARELA